MVCHDRISLEESCHITSSPRCLACPLLSRQFCKVNNCSPHIYHILDSDPEFSFSKQHFTRSWSLLIVKKCPEKETHSLTQQPFGRLLAQEKMKPSGIGLISDSIWPDQMFLGFFSGYHKVSLSFLEFALTTYPDIFGLFGAIFMTCLVREIIITLSPIC